jgi:hypothetical protein
MEDNRKDICEPLGSFPRPSRNNYLHFHMWVYKVVVRQEAESWGSHSYSQAVEAGETS